MVLGAIRNGEERRRRRLAERDRWFGRLRQSRGRRCHSWSPGRWCTGRCCWGNRRRRSSRHRCSSGFGRCRSARWRSGRCRGRRRDYRAGRRRAASHRCAGHQHHRRALGALRFAPCKFGVDLEAGRATIAAANDLSSHHITSRHLTRKERHQSPAQARSAGKPVGPRQCTERRLKCILGENFPRAGQLLRYGKCKRVCCSRSIKPSNLLASPASVTRRNSPNGFTPPNLREKILHLQDEFFLDSHAARGRNVGTLSARFVYCQRCSEQSRSTL